MPPRLTLRDNQNPTKSLPATITMIPSPTIATPESHPDCRADLSQIVALQCPVLRTISLMDTPSLTRPRMTAFASSRRRYPSYCSRSAAVRSFGFTVAVPIAMRTCRIDLRTASRKAWLAFSIRCQRSATCSACGRACAAACAYPPPRSRATISMCGCSTSQAFAVEGSRSGNNAIVFRRSRSQMIVPYR